MLSVLHNIIVKHSAYAAMLQYHNHEIVNCILIWSGWNAVCTFIIYSEYIRGCECTVSSVSFQMSHGNKAAVVKSYLATVFTEGSQQKNTHEDGLNVAIH